MPDEPAVAVAVADAPSEPEPEPAADDASLLVDEINHDRITRLEERLDEIHERLGSVVTMEALSAMTVPPHEHPELAGRIEALEAQPEPMDTNEAVVVEPPPEPEPEDLEDDEGPEADGKLHLRVW